MILIFIERVVFFVVTRNETLRLIDMQTYYNLCKVEIISRSFRSLETGSFTSQEHHVSFNNCVHLER